MDGLALFDGIVIEKSQGMQFQTGVFQYLPDGLFPRGAGTDDEEAFVLLPFFRQEPECTDIVRQRQPDADPDAADKKEGQKPVDDEGGPGVSPKMIDVQDGQNEDQRGNHRGLEDVFHVFQARVAPHPSVEAEKGEAEQLHGHEIGQDMDDPPPFEVRQLPFVPQEIGTDIGCRHEGGIDEKHVIKMLVLDELLHFKVRSRAAASARTGSSLAKQKRARSSPPPS